MDDSGTVWVEREYVGHGFRDDDLSRLRTERVVFDECDFRAASTSPNPSPQVRRSATAPFDRAILHHSTFRQRSLLGSVFTDCRMRPLSLLECDFTLAVLGGCDLWGAAFWSAHHSSLGLVAVNRRLTWGVGADQIGLSPIPVRVDRADRAAILDESVDVLIDQRHDPGVDGDLVILAGAPLHHCT